MLFNPDFTSKLNPLELVAWESFKNVVDNFLHNHKADNCLVSSRYDADLSKNGMSHVSENVFPTFTRVLLSR